MKMTMANSGSKGLMRAGPRWSDYAARLSRRSLWIVVQLCLFRFQGNRMFPPHPLVKNILWGGGGLRDREITCSASERLGSNSESSEGYHGPVFPVGLYI